jgi:hypothetical protein
MLKIGEALISLDLLEKNFCCNVAACKGECCVQGDSGAPLEFEELKQVEENYPKIKHYLRDISVETIEEQGMHVIDADNDRVTPLVNGNECAYVIFEEGIAKCAFEKGFEEGICDFQKPVSCHLYPIRIKQFADFEALNYDSWSICKPALKNGRRLGLPIYKFNKDALIRKYGQAWYDELDEVAQQYLNRPQD